MREPLGCSEFGGDLKNCERCGERKATTPTFVVIQDSAEYWELCETCCDLMVAENEAAGRRRVQADPAGTVRQMETNLGRPLTSEELRAFDEYLAGSGPNEAP
jgi:protein-arginine kinase activator protein McsA